MCFHSLPALHSGLQLIIIIIILIIIIIIISLENTEKLIVTLVNKPPGGAFSFARSIGVSYRLIVRPWSDYRSEL